MNLQAFIEGLKTSNFEYICEGDVFNKVITFITKNGKVAEAHFNITNPKQPMTKMLIDGEPRFKRGIVIRTNINPKPTGNMTI